MNIKKLLMTLLPFLYSFATKLWANTPKEQQDTAILAVKFANLIKSGATANDIASDLSLPLTTVQVALTGVAYAIGHPEFSPDEVIKYYQDKVAAGISDIGYNTLFDGLAKILTQHVSQDKVDWTSLALGVVKIAFDLIK